MQSARVERSAQRALTGPQQEQLKRVRIPVLSGGQNTNVDPSDLPPSQSPALSNLLVVQGQLRPDTGYVSFGGGSFEGTPQAVFQVNHADGSDSTVLVTTKYAYYLNNGLWTAGRSGLNTVAQYNAGATQVVFNITSTSQGFTVGGQIQFLLDNGSLFTTTITALNQTLSLVDAVPAGRNIPSGANARLPAAWHLHTTYNAGATAIQLDLQSGTAGFVYIVSQGIQFDLDDASLFSTSVAGSPTPQITITMADAVPAGRNIPNGAPLLYQTPLNGRADTQVFAVSYPPNDWIIFTNGIDPPFYLHTNMFAVLGTPGVCRSLAVFHECLLLLGMVYDTHAGGARLRRIWMSDAGDPQNYTSGISAFYDLLDTDDDIHCAYPLGPWLILYRNTSIMRATYLGILDQILFWEYMVVGEGSWSPGAVAPITIANDSDAYHVFLGHFNVYRYRGDYKLEPIGDAIWQTYFASMGRANQAVKSTTFLQYVGQWQEFWIVFAIDDSTLPNYMLRYHLRGKGWFPRQFANRFLSVDPFLTNLEVQATPRMVMADETAVYMYDYEAVDDAGAQITWSLETKDIGEGNVQCRFDRVLMYGRGSDVKLEYSVDQGRTWQLLGIGYLGTTASAVVVANLGLGGAGCVSEYLRLRLSGYDQGFRLAWLEVWYEVESEWTLGQPFVVGVSDLGGSDWPV